MASHKLCQDCRKLRPVSWYRKNRHYDDGLGGHCMLCRGKVEATGFKICARCDRIRPLDDFFLHKYTRTGRKSWCRDCAAVARAAVEAPVVSAKETKRCTRCQAVKKVDAFYLDKTGAKGRTGRCRECCNKDREEWRKAQIEKSPTNGSSTSEKHCKSCKSLLPLSDFGPRRDATDGLRGTCRSCENARRSGAVLDPRDATNVAMWKQREVDFEERVEKERRLWENSKRSQ